MGEQFHNWVEEFSLAVKVSLSPPDDYDSEHKWVKKSISLELEYWSMHLIRHNLDVMHIEKTVFDNISNTVIVIKKKMKDNLSAWRDLKIICTLELEWTNVMSKAVYTLTKKQKRKICE
ncbi:UNVERIFIED_CONTAM: hypothetical protein Sradi_4134600 [Sesamum radiatum]|uniref:Uncharacterized protein n=1 Tax=Sesamum radiatum TaxID=300843 RepID=A0AAW2P4L3_SESRA